VRIHGQAYYDSLSESLMGLSLSRRIDVPWYTSDRMQQTMGNGVCVVSPKTPGLTELFKEDEAVWFDSEEEITELVSWYSNNPDQARSIAEKGWKAVHERCSAQRVAKYMLERVFKMELSEDYEWSDQFYQTS
jgi:spore maturation protein CgeB